MNPIKREILDILMDDEARSAADIRAELDSRCHDSSEWLLVDVAQKKRAVRRALRQLEKRGLLHRVMVSGVVRAEVYGWELMGASR